MQLSFQNSIGERKIIAVPLSKNELIFEINKFLREHNYKSHYMNVCEYEENKLRIDVGSWTEFFYVDGMSLQEWQE